MVELKDIVAAYRMAKIDGWYMHSLDLVEVRDFERNFEANIVCVQNRINAMLNGKPPMAEELGSWKLETKKVSPKKQTHDAAGATGEATSTSQDGQVFFSDPRQDLSNKLESLSFRLLAQPTILFHVLSSLWIAKVGYKYDQHLGKYSYGNRLRPLDRDTKMPAAHRAGSFKYYIKKFKEWRDDALKNVLKHLKDLGEDVAIVTADAHAFYHRLKPNFLLNAKYLEKAGIRLDGEVEARLTGVLVAAINVWASKTPMESGLPVGLPASAVIANAALVEFDAAIHDDIQPLFYGRYVDDIILVFKWIKKWKSLGEVWSWVAERSADKIIKYESKNFGIKHESQQPQKRMCLCFDPPDYKKDLTEKDIVFVGSKCKAFFLDTKTGIPLVEAFRDQLKDLSSEFRLLPERAGDQYKIRNKIRHLLPEDGNVADNIRKIKSQEFRRSDFMALLKELEAIERVVPSELWSEQREEFYSAFIESLMNWRLFPDFEKYIARVIALMTRNGDFESILSLVHKIVTLHLEVGKQFERLEISGMDEEMDRKYMEQWYVPLFANIRLAIQSNVKARKLTDQDYETRYKKLCIDLESIESFSRLAAFDEAFEEYARAFLIHDISNEKLAAYVQRRECLSLASVSMIEDRLLQDYIGGERARAIVGDDLYDSARLLQNVMGRDSEPQEDGVFYGLLFPTRPVSVQDLCLIRKCILNPGQVKDIIKTYRGYDISSSVGETLQSIYNISTSSLAGGSPVLPRVIISDQHRKTIDVALMSIRTAESAICLEMKTKITAEILERYKKVVRLVNDVLRQPHHPQYIVFHELCLPPKWFAQIAEKCFRSGVSIISGIDYIKIKDVDSEKTCSNELWMSIVSLDAGFPTQIFLSERKNRLAYGEAIQLKTKYGFSLAPVSGRESEHAIISHGDFSFSTLICSELTEMPKRCRLIGKIDALFVVSWNQDLNSFDALVKATASDIHCYVVVCNNNEHGDSRVRAPKKKEWARDVVEVRGGEEPYFVIGRLEVEKLRKYQSHANPAILPNPEFKPLPMGFVMDPTRKVDV